MALKAGYKGIKKFGPGLKYDNVNGILNLEGESDLSLDNLKDVNITTPADGDYLTYDSSNEEWYNEQPDSTPTEDSSNLITSGGVYAAIEEVDVTDLIPDDASSSNKLATASDVNDIWSANAVLGVHNQLNVRNVIAGHSKAVVSNISDNGFTVATSESAANVASKNTLDSLVIGNRYKVSFSTTNDNANAKCAIRDSNSVIKEYVTCPTIGNYTLEFTMASGYYLAMFCTGSSSATGTLTVSNLMITPIEDTCTDVTPFAMTNQQLMEKVQGIIDEASNAADFAAFKTAIGSL